jgi:hypothetical protein
MNLTRTIDREEWLLIFINLIHYQSDPLQESICVAYLLANEERLTVLHFSCVTEYFLFISVSMT